MSKSHVILMMHNHGIMGLNVDEGPLEPAVWSRLLGKSLLNVAPAVTCAYPRRPKPDHKGTENVWRASWTVAALSYSAVLFSWMKQCQSFFTYDLLIFVRIESIATLPMYWSLYFCGGESAASRTLKCPPHVQFPFSALSTLSHRYHLLECQTTSA